MMSASSAANRSVSVVMVTYRSRETIADALNPLEHAALQDQIECVIVDNASGDGTADFIASHYPWVKLVRSSENLGFGRGCNAGFAESTSDYVLFLNPDAVIEPAAITALVDVMTSHPNAAVVGPATLVGPEPATGPVPVHGQGALQMAGMLLEPRTLLATALNRRNAYPDRRAIIPGDAPFRTSWICGAIMMFRASAFRALGGFDPRFFLYFEETDLCLRAARAGFELWATGTATAYHVCGSSARASGEAMESGCIAEHYYKSRFYYLSKNFGPARAIAAESVFAVAMALRHVGKRLLGRPSDPSGQWWTRPFLRRPEPLGEDLL